MQWIRTAQAHSMMKPLMGKFLSPTTIIVLVVRHNHEIAALSSAVILDYPRQMERIPRPSGRRVLDFRNRWKSTVLLANHHINAGLRRAEVIWFCPFQSCDDRKRSFNHHHHHHYHYPLKDLFYDFIYFSFNTYLLTRIISWSLSLHITNDTCIEDLLKIGMFPRLLIWVCCFMLRLPAIQTLEAGRFQMLPIS